MGKWLNDHAKAITGALAFAVFTYLRLAGNGMTGDEWSEVLMAALTGGGAVWAIPNSMSWRTTVQPTSGGGTVVETTTPGPIDVGKHEA
jgi:hypothetical protein